LQMHNGEVLLRALLSSALSNIDPHFGGDLFYEPPH